MSDPREPTAEPTSPEKPYLVPCSWCPPSAPNLVAVVIPDSSGLCAACAARMKADHSWPKYTEEGAGMVAFAIGVCAGVVLVLAASAIAEMVLAVAR